MRSRGCTYRYQRPEGYLPCGELFPKRPVVVRYGEHRLCAVHDKPAAREWAEQRMGLKREEVTS